MPHEQPTEDIIEDDDQLDRWWKSFWDNKKREMAKHMAPQKGQRVDFNKLPMFQGEKQ